MKKESVLAFTISVVIACGPGEDVPDTSSVSRPALEVSLSIGMELGDSCYVFGDIRDCCVMEDGRILVLDGVTCAISCYSSQGEYIQRIGGSGEGPGEYIRPFCMIALSDGRVAVSDPGMSRITFLNSDLSVDTVVSGFIPWSPERIAPSAEGSFTGSYRIFDRENSMYGKLVALWSDTPGIDFEYYNQVALFNRDRLRESTEECEIVFTSDFSGNVYLSPYSYDSFSIVAMDSRGNTLYTVEENRTPRERPYQEIESEREDMREQLQNEGAPPDMLWNPSEYRAMVPMRGLGIDPWGRLWVRDGREDSPAFDVYEQGEQVFHVRLDTVSSDDNLRVKITERGILAWSPDPECYPVLHVLELVE